MEKRSFLGLAAVALALIVGAVVAADEDKAKDDEAVTTAELAKIERSLDDVLASQQQVLQKFDGIAEELRIIKVRATSRGALSN